MRGALAGFQGPGTGVGDEGVGAGGAGAGVGEGRGPAPMEPAIIPGAGRLEAAELFPFKKQLLSDGDG
jgi:hypothetical protein